MNKKPSWNDFYKDFITNNYVYDLIYLDNVYTIGSENKKFSSKPIWFLATQHTLNSKPIYKQFSSPQELLNRATINGKTLKSIWDDIIIDQDFKQNN